ncbi:unnamed protein product [Amoebophrya sp. A120]|nr:unnamed protein product [Amoebophrya sp. A120]|eukprot:GSA120T00012342001.1
MFFSNGDFRYHWPQFGSAVLPTGGSLGWVTDLPVFPPLAIVVGGGGLLAILVLWLAFTHFGTSRSRKNGPSDVRLMSSTASVFCHTTIIADDAAEKRKPQPLRLDETTRADRPAATLQRNLNRSVTTGRSPNAARSWKAIRDFFTRTSSPNHASHGTKTNNFSMICDMMAKTGNHAISRLGFLTAVRLSAALFCQLFYCWFWS